MSASLRAPPGAGTSARGRARAFSSCGAPAAPPRAPRAAPPRAAPRAAPPARRPAAAAAAAAAAGDGAAPAAPSTEGRMTYRPESYSELITDAAAALLAGIDAGLTRMEVEFPTIPTSIDGAARRALGGGGGGGGCGEVAAAGASGQWCGGRGARRGCVEGGSRVRHLPACSPAPTPRALPLAACFPLPSQPTRAPLTCSSTQTCSSPSRPPSRCAPAAALGGPGRRTPRPHRAAAPATCAGNHLPRRAQAAPPHGAAPAAAAPRPLAPPPPPAPPLPPPPPPRGPRQLAAAGRRVHVVLPDLGEYARSHKIFKAALESLGGAVSLGHLKEAPAKAGGVDLVNSFQALFAGGAPDPAPAGAAADVYLVTNVSCVEVPALEAYCADVARGKPLATWCVVRGGGRGSSGTRARLQPRRGWRSGAAPLWFPAQALDKSTL
jgi:hypothetical protein